MLPTFGALGRLLGGAFIASGVFHMVRLQSVDAHVMLLFALQPVGLVLKGAWRRLAAWRVGGGAGWQWVVGLREKVSMTGTPKAFIALRAYITRWPLWIIERTAYDSGP
ncbi:hypothetical protein B0H21DRAFT_822614 [Amylocystis lapponica]|nr:hypothetical protein B0H21DRAFT_822614 [Amylocystis lapponica]